MRMGQFNLLLIEKNSINSCYLQLPQHRNDVSLTLANNENETLITLLYTRFNLILLDAALANTDIVNFVKSAGSLNCKTPVIVMLTAQESHLKAHFLALGADDCWVMPLSTDVLDQLINRQKNTGGLAPNDYLQILLDKTQHNKNLTITIFKKLFAELPRQITDIRHALQNKQYQAALDITHKLHGSVSFCGFTDLQHYAYNLENSLSRKEYQAVKDSYSALKTAILNFTAKESVILDGLKQ
jgi:HPt (histidine-containing phosphotransfer) domain-containing protein